MGADVVIVSIPPQLTCVQYVYNLSPNALFQNKFDLVLFSFPPNLFPDHCMVSHCFKEKSLPDLHHSPPCLTLVPLLQPLSAPLKEPCSLLVTGHSVPLSGGVYLINSYSSFRSLESLLAQLVKNLLAMQETWVQSLGWEDPWRREWQPPQNSCLENSMDRGVWQATVHGITEADTTEQLTHTPQGIFFDPLPGSSLLSLNAFIALSSLEYKLQEGRKCICICSLLYPLYLIQGLPYS